MRTKKVLLNALSSFGGQALLIIVNLLSRKIFLQILGEEYLGLNSLFANVLTLLSMAELGVGNAITYSLYKPLAQKDEKKVVSLMRLFQIVYVIIGIIVLVFGILLSPFLGGIVKSENTIDNLHLIYFLFLINTTITYFFSYRSALVIADQNQYIFNINHYLCQIILYTFQIAVLLITHNYYLYLITQIFITLVENISISIIAEKKYPYLKNLKRQKISIDKDTVSEIKKNAAGMIFSKIGSTIVNSTDNILISTFISVGLVGVYGNYITISNAVSSVLFQLMNASVASIGNLSVDADSMTRKKVFEKLYFIEMWIYGFASACLLVLLGPFISLWYGASYMISNAVVILICINVFITGQSVLLSIYISAMGLYWKNRFTGIIEAILNLVISVALVRYLGIEGILLGTIISHVLWNIPFQVYVVLKNGIDKSIKSYTINLICDTIIFLLISVLLGIFIPKIRLEGVLGFIIKLLICVILPNIIYLIIYRRKSEFKELSTTFIRLARRKT